MRADKISLPVSLVRLFQHLSMRRRWQLVGLIFFMLIGAAAEMATLGVVIPFLAVLSGLAQASCSVPASLCDLSLTEASALFVTVVAIASVVRILLLRESNRFAFALGADIGNEVYRRVLYQPYLYHTSHNTSEIIAGINKVNLLVQQVINPLTQGTVALILGFAIFTALLSVDATSAVAAMFVFAVLYVITTVITRRSLRKNGRNFSENEGRRIQAVQEGLGGIRDVLIDGTQSIYVDRFSKFNSAQRHAQAANSFIQKAPRYIIEAVGMILLVGLAFWINQRSSLAETIPILGVLAFGAQKLLPQAQQVYSAWAAVTGNHAVLHHVLYLLDKEIPEEYFVREASTAQEVALKQPNFIPLMSVKNLSFHYSSDNKPILVDINLEIHRGNRIGIIGKTGSGKSTLIDLIMGLLEPSSGSIVVDGVPLTSFNRRAWQARVAHVPQAIFLSDASIIENIAFGMETSKIDFQRVESSVHCAQLTDFINSLPEGYRTQIGERGVRLSGGQRQRIGIARALYKRADILVLDEATSALDDDTEMSISREISSLRECVTVISIAHRLTSLKGYEKIIEIRDGNISWVGSYKEMMERNSQSND